MAVRRPARTATEAAGPEEQAHAVPDGAREGDDVVLTVTGCKAGHNHKSMLSQIQVGALTGQALVLVGAENARKVGKVASHKEAKCRMKRPLIDPRCMFAASQSLFHDSCECVLAHFQSQPVLPCHR